ncbi:MAG: nitroreductase family protein [Bacteroidota bacterium]
MKKIILTILFVVFASAGFSQILTDIQLPKPNTVGGKPLMEALKDRQTRRDFSAKELTNQQLSDLLWAAFGINRTDGKRTAPSAVNWQETIIYVCLNSGVYIYDAKNNLLKAISETDSRSKMGIQTFVGDAPVVLAFVCDYSQMGIMASKEEKEFYGAVDVGYISQNVYLYCSSENLATVVLGYINNENITKTLNLKENQKITLTQCVGYPK